MDARMPARRWMTDFVARQPYVGDNGRATSGGAIGVFDENGIACVALVIPGCLAASGRDDAAREHAALISAAPDLLAALQRTLSWLTSYQGSAAMGKDGPYEQARAAIARATEAAS